MLDLIFLMIGIFVFVMALRGQYNEMFGIIAMVSGLLAGGVGCVVGIVSGDAIFVILNFIVMFIALALPRVARQLVKLYNDKRAEEAAEWERLYPTETEDGKKEPVYTDETFDDEYKRFGEGGWTDRNSSKVDLTKKDKNNPT